MTEKQVKEFLISKNIDMFKINGDLVASNYPESYKFVEKTASFFNYGEVDRDKKKIMKNFNTNEECLFYLIMKKYGVKVQIALQKGVFKSLNNTDNQVELIKNLAVEKELDIFSLKIENQQQLKYKNKLLINNVFYKSHTIEEFYLLKLFELKSFEIVKEELLEFGIDKEVVNNYFNFEWYYSIEQED